MRSGKIYAKTVNFPRLHSRGCANSPLEPIREVPWCGFRPAPNMAMACRSHPFEFHQGQESINTAPRRPLELRSKRLIYISMLRLILRFIDMTWVTVVDCHLKGMGKLQNKLLRCLVNDHWCVSNGQIQSLLYGTKSW